MYDWKCEELARTFLEGTQVWQEGHLSEKEKDVHIRDLAQDIQIDIEKYIEWYHLDEETE